MSDIKENQFSFWKRLSDLILYNTFQYIDSENYNVKISQVALETYHLLHRDDITISIYDFLIRKDENEKAFIYIVLEDILVNKNFNDDLELTTVSNKEIIEEALNTISVQLPHNDYEFPTYNDYSKTMDVYLLQKEQAQNLAAETIIQPSQKYKNHVDTKLNIHSVHNNLYNEIVFYGLDVWRGLGSSNLYYRVKPYEKEQKTDKTKLSSYLSKVLQKNVEIYDSVKDIEHSEANYLIISLLPIVKMEVFNPKLDVEFPFIQNNMYYKNTFQYTSYLKSRYLRPLPFVNVQNSIIYQFIKKLSQNDFQFNYIMNWLAHYFQKLSSSKMPLVLIGDKETTDTLIYDIIRPIFAFKNDYICTMNADILNNESFDFIVSDRLFYHVDDISNSNAKDKNTSKLILEILKSKYQNAEEAWENNESFINGELIITSSKNSPYTFLKDSYSRCNVFKVKHIDSIVKTLKIDRARLNEEIRKDLEHFSNILALHPLDNSYLGVIETPEKDVLYSMKNGVLRTPELDKNIEAFKEAIKLKKLDYFQNIKNENPELFKELDKNFKDGMIAQPLLSEYFNFVHNDIIFLDNSSLLEILKEDRMFKKAPSDDTKYNGKKRYKILS